MTNKIKHGNVGDVSILMKNEEPTVKKGASYNTGGGAIIPTSSNNSNANSTSSNSGMRSHCGILGNATTLVSDNGTNKDTRGRV